MSTVPDDVDTPQWLFRCLFNDIYEHWDEPLNARVLQPWLEENGRECGSWLRAFASAPGNPVPLAHRDEINCLYAVSRVNQLLLHRFQPERTERHQPGPCVEMPEYLNFFTQLGMTVETSADYHPFYHEIVDVQEAADPNQPPALVESYWPCLMLGNMLFSRAGVRVSAGSAAMNKALAECSMIYWSYVRNNRPYEDQSHGWGSNSQWATFMRRDYRIGDEFYLNVDAEVHVTGNGTGEPDPLPIEQRIELVKYHHFVLPESAPYAAEEQYPYLWGFCMSARDGSIRPMGFTPSFDVRAAPNYERPDGTAHVAGNFHDLAIHDPVRSSAR